MNGTNEVHFNKVTMCEIVEHYLNTVLFTDKNPVIVSSFEETGNGYNKVFKVEFTPKEKPIDRATP